MNDINVKDVQKMFFSQFGIRIPLSNIQEALGAGAIEIENGKIISVKDYCPGPAWIDATTSEDIISGHYPKFVRGFGDL